MSSSVAPIPPPMFSALASLLLFGAVPPAIGASPALRPLPGIEVVHVSSPGGSQEIALPTRLSASGMILLDMENGRVLFSRNADQPRPMASLTKIMTALLILEQHDLGETVIVPPFAEQIRGSTLGVKAGDRFSVGALMKAMLLSSANDVAYTFAVFDGRSVAGFVRKMNDRAASLGLKNTHFTNPAGLDNDQQYSTPHDLAWLTMAALKNADFRSIVRMKTGRIATNDGKTFDLRNTNELLQENEHVWGVKTGTTDGAGECLIILFEHLGHPYLLVLLGSKDRYTDSLVVLQSVHSAAMQ